MPRKRWNHIFYFFAFSPDGGGNPTGDLAEAINRDFGSFDEFKKLFVKAGTDLFGSGYVWLSQDKNGKLFITQGKDAANPMTQGLTPILLSTYGNMPTISTIRTGVLTHSTNCGILSTGK